MTSMRLRRIVAVLGLAAALSLPAAASAAESKRHVGLHDMTCTSITAMGKGLAKNSAMQLTLTNRANGNTLAGQTVRTSAKGDFMVKGSRNRRTGGAGAEADPVGASSFARQPP
jgi:hypothetical protein